MGRKSWEDIGIEADGTLFDKRTGLPILPPSTSEIGYMALADVCGVWLMLNHKREGRDVANVDDFAPARAFVIEYGDKIDLDLYHPDLSSKGVRHYENIPERIRLFAIDEVIE